MLQAMYNGVSAIQANQEDMDVIGNNISNVDTTAFKSGTVNFADQLSQTMQGASAGNSSVGGTNPMQIGLGVKVASVETNMSQGGLQAASTPTDLAIQGNGFFMLGSPSGMTYTRDGSFSVDSSGYLVNSSGQYVLGWTASPNGTVDTNNQITQQSRLNIPVGSLQATAPTTNVVYSGNLNADSTSSSTPYSTAVTVYDSVGNAQTVNLAFSPESSLPSGAPSGATSAWTWTASGAAISGTPSGTTNTGTIYFNSTGQEVSATGGVVLTNSDGSSTPQPITLDFSQVGQTATSSSVAAASQDGYAPGTLQSFSIDQTGTISGIFTNGETRVLGQIGMTNFANPAGLQSVGGNNFEVSVNSGLPQVGAATTGSFGQISSGYLEQSNVDLSTEFANMIVTQNAYQANTKVVSTVNQMLTTLIDMKQ